MSLPHSKPDITDREGNTVSQEYILEMTGITKEFPGVRALKGVELKVRPGTVHTLMGENGAGKSTLMKCLIGIHPPTSGTILFEGKEVRFKNTLEALNAGISMIHQELSPVPERSVCENLWLGRAPRKGLIVDHKKMRRDSIELFQRLNLDVDPDEKMGNLTVAKMQMVEIAKAVSYDSRIVIMDEPTSSLTDAEVEHLFRIIEDLKKKNVAIIYISHKMDEIFRISDDITVYRDGEYIATDRAENLNVDKLIQLMVGREVTDMFPKVDCPIGKPSSRWKIWPPDVRLRTYPLSCTAVRFWAWPVWSARDAPRPLRPSSACAVSPAVRSTRTAKNCTLSRLSRPSQTRLPCSPKTAAATASSVC